MGLLDSLFNLNNNGLGYLGNLGIGPSPMAGDPAAVPLTPTTGDQFPAPNSPTGYDTSAGAVQAPQDTWAPKHETILGALADAYLRSRGMAPAYAQAAEQQNMQAAMQNITTDPMQAIKRMMMVNPAQGYQMYKDYQAQQDKADIEKRQEANLDRQNNIFDLQKEKYVYEKVGAMMNAAKDDDNKWDAMRTYALQYGNKLGVDVSSIIPEKRDPSSIDFITQGQVPVKDQEKIAVQQQNANTRQQSADQRNANAQANIALRKQAMEQRQQNQKVPTHFIPTKYGPGQVYANGRNLSVKVGTNPDGSTKYAIYSNRDPTYIPGSQNWQLDGYQDGTPPK